jgi:hypothetical protein
MKMWYLYLSRQTEEGCKSIFTSSRTYSFLLISLCFAVFQLLDRSLIQCKILYLFWKSSKRFTSHVSEACCKFTITSLSSNTFTDFRSCSYYIRRKDFEMLWENLLLINCSQCARCHWHSLPLPSVIFGLFALEHIYRTLKRDFRDKHDILLQNLEDTKRHTAHCNSFDRNVGNNTYGSTCHERR